MRHVGDIVAMVVATSRAAAKDAAELVMVDYTELPAVIHSRQAMAADAPRAWSDAASNLCLDATVGDAGATDAAFAAAAHVVRFSTSVQRIAGVTMEPRAAIGEYDPATGRYTLHAGAGGAVRPRHDTAVVLGVTDDDVRMVMHDVGGNFGTRGAFNPEFALVAWAARRVGRAVKWTCERSEAFLCDYQARDLTADAELALDAQGTFLAMRGTNMVNQRRVSRRIRPAAQGRRDHDQHLSRAGRAFPRRRDAHQHRADPAISQLRPARGDVRDGTADRSGGAPVRASIASNCGGATWCRNRPCRTAIHSALVYDSGTYHKVMERVLALGDWTGFPARRAEAKRRGRCRGIGVANYVDTATGVPRERAEITVQPEGVVEVVIGTVSSGQGHETSFAQLVSEWLGVPIDSVALVHGRHRPRLGRRRRRIPAARCGSAASSCWARRTRSSTKGCGSPATCWKPPRPIWSFPPAASSSRAPIARSASSRSRPRRCSATICRTTCAAWTAIGDETVNLAAFPYGCHVCEVEVDPETGVVQIARYTAVDDVGRAVNPMIVHGQVHGGITHGIGQALLEQCWYDPQSGQLLSGSFMDYAIARADEVPSYVTELSEVPSPTHPLGIRPAGEGGTTPALGAVVNAIVDALAEFGVTHIEMPATPERVWRAIHAQ